VSVCRWCRSFARQMNLKL